MKIEVYFLASNFEGYENKIDLLITIKPITAEAQYFTLCKRYHNIDGRVVVKSYNSIILDAEYITGKCDEIRREQNLKRYKMIWARSADWIKSCPLQMRGLAMACCGTLRY